MPIHHGMRWLSYGVLCLDHAIENKANQSRGKLLYILPYFVQLSHCAPHVCRIDCVVHCFYMAWYYIPLESIAYIISIYCIKGSVLYMVLYILGRGVPLGNPYPFLDQ